MRHTGSRPRAARWARLRRGVLAAAAVVAAAVLFAADPPRSDAASSAGTLTLYSAQHPETTSALVAAFEKQTGIKVRVKSDDEDVLTAQIEQEGSHSPADVFFTENSNWLAQLDEKGLLAKVSKSTLAEVPGARQRGQRRLARGLRPLQRPDLQPEQDQRLAGSAHGDGAGRSEVQGQARARAVGDGLLADRHLGRPRRRAGRRAHLAARD